jgi:hypothetical protein
MATGTPTRHGSSSPAVRRWRVLAALASAGGAALVAALGAYGGADGGSGASGKQTAVPACAKVGVGKPRPGALPARFPLPAGTAIAASAVPRAGELIVSGAVPGGLQAAADFMRDELGARGYVVSRGDAEPGEAEAPFFGHGLRGKWKLNEIVACRAVKLTLVLLRGR